MNLDERSLWVAVLPQEDVEALAATAWRALINVGGGEHGIDSFRLRAPATSLRLEWFDEALSSNGYVRVSAWEPASRPGFRAWIEPLGNFDTELAALLAEHASADD